MRDRKFQMSWYQVGDGEALAAHLEKMAAKGWHLEKLSQWGYIFRRGEAKRVHYTVTYFPEASLFDGVPGDKQGTYIDYCAAAGWVLAAAQAQLQVFRSEQADPTPIETDEETKLRAIHGTAKKTILWGNALLLAVWAMNLGLRLHDLLDDPARFLSDSASLCLLVLILGLVAETALTLIEYTVWYLRSRRSVERGGACAKFPTAFRQVRLRLLLAVSVLAVVGGGLDMADAGHGTFYLCCFAGMALLMAACTWVVRGLRRRRSKSGAWGIYTAAVVALSVVYIGGVIFLAFHLPDAAPDREPVATYTTDYGATRELYRDELPVTLEDLGYAVTEEDACTYEAEEERTILLTRRTYRQRSYSAKSELPTLKYELLDIPWDWLRGFCLRELVDGIEASRTVTLWPYQQVEDPRWGAEKVYAVDYLSDGAAYLLQSGSRLILIRLDWRPTDEQVEVLRAALVERQ